jgi:hypothetical protein
MEIFQKAPELDASSPARRRLQAASEPHAVKKPKFPKDLFDHEKGSGFVDPVFESSILLPQQSIASAQIVLETEASSKYGTKKAQSRESFFSSIIEYLSAWLSLVSRKFRGSKRARARLTVQGEQALGQLRYLAALCDATSHRSPEEVLLAESAFGEAYYEIMNLSSNLEKMSEKEAAHHLHRYSKHMATVLQASD